MLLICCLCFYLDVRKFVISVNVIVSNIMMLKICSGNVLIVIEFYINLLFKSEWLFCIYNFFLWIDYDLSINYNCDYLIVL